MSNIYVFEAEINKLGTNESVKTLHVLANTMFDASHLLMHYVEDNPEFRMPVEIGSIQRLTEIENILIDPDIFDGDEDEYTGKEPLEMAENAPDEQIIKFKCSCGEELRVMDGNWPYVVCPNCSNNIRRREVENIGGFYIYTKLDDNK